MIISFLAFRAEEGGAPSDNNTLNFCATVGAWFAGPVVDLEIVLKLTPSINSIQAGAFMHNPGIQGLPDSVIQPLQLFRRKGLNLAARVETGDKTALVGVDIAHPGHKFLIQQQGL